MLPELNSDAQQMKLTTKGTGERCNSSWSPRLGSDGKEHRLPIYWARRSRAFTRSSSKPRSCSGSGV